LRRLDDFLRDGVAAGRVSAASAIVGTADRVLWQGVAGLARRRPARAARRGDRFDLASLTKPVVATLAIVLDQRGLLPLAMPVGEVWPEAAPPLRRRPLESLLRHRAGLRPWAPLYRLCREPGEAEALLIDGSLLGARLDAYSDLDYILWGYAARRVLGAPVGELLRRHRLAAPGRGAVGVQPGDRADVVESRMGGTVEAALAAAGGWRIRALPPPPPGLAQDGNARFLGGCPGHAGLFGPADALWRLGAAWLGPAMPRLLPAAAVARALGGPAGSHGLGWMRRRVGGSAGPALAPEAFGHTGFAGGSLWIDPTADRVLVLLAHKIDPDLDLNPWRRRFHALAMSELGP
jgi:CubicO group peptidase (beta-lactamase class C family)